MRPADITQAKVAMLVGGWSDERDISISSGHACANALSEAGFAHVDIMDVAEDDFVQKLMAGGYDVAFVAMHGRWGEDGCIQGLLEILHIPYTFSGVLASATATEKEAAKNAYRAVGIPTPCGIVIESGHMPDEDEIADIVDQLGCPLFVKPSANGSSCGASIANGADELPNAIAIASAGGQNVIVEQYVSGTEVTVPVIGNREPRALPVIEIISGDGAEFYDFKVKYEPSELHHVMPARLAPESYAKVQEYAMAAHRVLGCRGASRSDFIVTADGTPYLLETNTIPGMTETSLLPDSAKCSGIAFPALCRMFVEWAFDR